MAAVDSVIHTAAPILENFMTVARMSIFVRYREARRNPVLFFLAAFPSLAFGSRSLVQRRPNSVCQLDGVVVGPKVDEEHARLFVQHMTVNGRYLDIAGAQRADQRVDFVAGHQKVSRDRG